MTAALAIAALKSTLTNLTHEDGSTTIKNIWPYPPEDPATGNFPAIAIELASDADYVIEPVTFQTPGSSNDTYPLNIFVFVGAPAAGNLGELHNRAIGWRVPLYKAIAANLNLSANCAVVGDAAAGDFKMTGRVGQINWSGLPLYGLVVRVLVTEYIS